MDLWTRRSAASRHGGGNLEVNTVTPSQVPCCCWANSANWVTRGLINSVLLLGFLGCVLGGQAQLAVVLLGFATGVTWQGEIGPGAAGIWKPAVLEMLLRLGGSTLQGF